VAALGDSVEIRMMAHVLEFWPTSL